MERAVSTFIRLVLTTALMTGGGVTLVDLVIQTQKEAKGAMKMGMSYGKWNRQLHKGSSR